MSVTHIWLKLEIHLEQVILAILWHLPFTFCEAVSVNYFVVINGMTALAKSTTLYLSRQKLFDFH